jgi:hypothetical protein
VNRKDTVNLKSPETNDSICSVNSGCLEELPFKDSEEIGDPLKAQANVARVYRHLAGGGRVSKAFGYE